MFMPVAGASTEGPLLISRLRQELHQQQARQHSEHRTSALSAVLIDLQKQKIWIACSCRGADLEKGLLEEDEHDHYSQRAPWLRAGVLGANDGLVRLE